MSPKDPGVPELDRAIAVLGQINILIPIVYGLGKTIAGLVSHHAASTDPATVEKAHAAIAGFAAASAAVTATGQEWLATHPAEG